MLSLFTSIIINLDSFGKELSNEEKVRKIIRILPKNKCGPKVTTIEEAQNLKKLKLDDLIGKLITHELTLNEDEGEQVDSMKNVILKAKKDDWSNDDSNESDDKDDPFIMVARGLS